MRMKNFLRSACLLILLVTLSFTSKAQKRTNLSNGVSLVQYGNTWIIEDNNRQQSISVEIAQAGIDRKNNEMMYNVICNGSVRKVAKWALRTAIAEGIKAASASGGSSLLVSASGLAVDIIYDKACDYWKKKGGY